MNSDEEKAFHDLTADKDLYRKLTGQLGDILKREGVLAQAAGQSLEIQAQAKQMSAPSNPLQSYYYIGGLFALLAGGLGWLWKMNGDTSNNSRDIDVIRVDLKALTKEFTDYKYQQAIAPRRAVKTEP